MLSDGKGVVT